MIEIGDKIQKIRELKNFTQEFMAQSLGVSTTAYGKIERNETEMSLTKLERIAKILEMDFRKILDFDEKMIFNIENGNNAAIGSINAVYHNEKFVEHLQQEVIYLREENKRLVNALNKRN